MSQRGQRSFTKRSVGQDYAVPLRGISPPKLFAYVNRAPPLPPNPVAQFIFGSALYAARVSVVFYTLYAYLVCWVIDTYIPTSWGIATWDPWILNTVYGAMMLFLTFHIFGGHSTQQDSAKFYTEMCGALKNYAGSLSATIIYDPKLPKDSTMAALKNSAHILRAIPYAVKYRYRDNSTIIVEKLPVTASVRTTLQNRGGDPIAELVNMLEIELSNLTVGKVIGGQPDRMNLALKALTGKLSALSNTRMFGALPVIMNLFMTALYSYFMALPIFLWATYGYYAIFAQFVACWFILGAVKAGTLMSNPFNKSEDSFFIYHDFSEMAHATAESTDKNIYINLMKITPTA